MRASRVDGLAVIEDVVIIMNARRAAELAARQRLPSVGFKEWPEAGGLLAYDTDIVPMGRRAATYVDKILKGAKPADLPVEQATLFHFVINRKTAKAMGLTFPQSIFLRATAVIE